VELDPLVSELLLFFFFDFLFELPDELLSVFELLFAAEPPLCDPVWEDPVWEDPPPGVDPPAGVVCPPFWATSAEAAKKNVKKAVFIIFPFFESSDSARRSCRLAAIVSGLTLTTGSTQNVWA
jgi:hypothetical protein